MPDKVLARGRLLDWLSLLEGRCCKETRVIKSRRGKEENQRLSRVQPGLSPRAAERSERSLAHVTGKGQMGKQSYQPCSQGPSAQRARFSSKVCSLKETLANWSHSLHGSLITHANTPEFSNIFFFPLQGYTVTAPKMSNIDINTRIVVGEEGAPKQLKKFCSLSYRYASSFLTTWLQLQFSFSQHRVPYANCYSEMTLIPQVCSREAIFKFSC